MGKKKSAETVADTKVSKVVNISISVGDDDSDRLIPEFIEAIRAALSDVGKTVTVTGAHYIIMQNGGGKVCRPDDYDPDTRDFRPGAIPPPWASASPEAGRVFRQQSAAPGARDPEHLRTVEETLRARGQKSTGKKLRVRPGSATGDLRGAVTRSESVTVSPPVDMGKVESEAEQSANSATSDLLSKLRSKTPKK